MHLVFLKVCVHNIAKAIIYTPPITTPIRNIETNTMLELNGVVISAQINYVTKYYK